MSSAMNHCKRSHRSQYRARAFQTGRVSVITPSINKRSTFDLIRLLRDFRRKQPETQGGRINCAAAAAEGGGEV